jgi:GntR family transcriptional regulator/MocR family aminotransferase
MLLSDPGDKVWLEDPGPDNVRAMLKSTGRTVVDVDVNRDGMDVGGAMQNHGDARLAFTMPSRQHPLGVTLGLPRRLQLLEWAKTNGSWIVEDAYDGEFRYSGRPLSSMRSIDATQSVIYVGTFSKSLFPALRIAYLVLPERLIGPFSNAIGTIARSVSTLEQATLADFIDQGYFAAYIRQMQNLYGMRREMFCQTAREVLSGLLDVETPESGINTIGWLPAGTNDVEVHHAARSSGIYCLPLTMFRARPSDNSGLILGFASADEVEMKQKLTLLATVLENRLESRQHRSLASAAD